MKKTVTILGSTGSVGVNTLRVITELGASFEIAGLAAGSKVGVLKEQIDEFLPKAVYLGDDHAAMEIKHSHPSLKIFTQRDGLAAFSQFLDSDILVAASTGTTALESVLGALDRGRRVALANKEILVMAGSLVMPKARKEKETLLLPVDSEHNAIFQCLEGSRKEGVRRLILTGSGGPLREISGDFKGISKEIVINHPKWKMGRKISVDSATLMNKGLEIVEASWLFDIPVESIDVLIHPEAVIHSMVEFVDGSVLAQLSVADMRLPIQYALCYPERLPVGKDRYLDFFTNARLTFSKPDRRRFPCLDLAYEAARRSGSAPCVLSAADEVAVGEFLDDKIDFTEIPTIIEKVLTTHHHVVNPDLREIQSIHDWATEETRRLCKAL